MATDLWQIRRQKRMTIDELARQAGIHPALIKAYELGERPIPERDMERLADALQVEAEDIKEMSDPPPRGPARQSPSSAPDSETERPRYDPGAGYSRFNTDSPRPSSSSDTGRSNYPSEPGRGGYGSESSRSNYNSEGRRSGYGGEAGRPGYGSEGGRSNYGSEGGPVRLATAARADGPATAAIADGPATAAIADGQTTALRAAGQTSAGRTITGLPMETEDPRATAMTARLRVPVSAQGSSRAPTVRRGRTAVA